MSTSGEAALQNLQRLLDMQQPCDSQLALVSPRYSTATVGALPADVHGLPDVFAAPRRGSMHTGRPLGCSAQSAYLSALSAPASHVAAGLPTVGQPASGLATLPASVSLPPLTLALLNMAKDPSVLAADRSAPASPQSQPGNPSTNPLYKTEPCRSWEETGHCRYGAKCQFAHGKEELRPVQRHPKYKTEVCRTFATTGTCPYGKRCRFIHYSAGPSVQAPGSPLSPMSPTSPFSASSASPFQRCNSWPPRAPPPSYRMQQHALYPVDWDGPDSPTSVLPCPPLGTAPDGKPPHRLPIFQAIAE